MVDGTWDIWNCRIPDAITASLAPLSAVDNVLKSLEKSVALDNMPG